MNNPLVCNKSLSACHSVIVLLLMHGFKDPAQNDPHLFHVNGGTIEIRICAKINLQIIQYVVSWLYGGYNHGESYQNNVATT